jgi:RNA polymerase sigma-70 factor (ECF subfamily)
MRASLEGDRRAYARLLRECVPLIRAVALRQGLSGPALEDAVQETLITIDAARHTWDPSRPFLPWLRALARYRSIDLGRRIGRTRSFEVQAPLVAERVADGAARADEQAASREDAERLRTVVAELPPGQRQAVEHLALSERSLDETAALTGRSKVALKVNLHRAIASMRRRLGEPGRE